MSRILPIAGIALALCQYAYAQAPPDTAAPLRLTLQDAMERAQKYSQQTLTANIAALVAREDTVQSRAALLPAVNGLSQFIYTQPNGTGSGVFVPNDGPRLYNDQAAVHADTFIASAPPSEWPSQRETVGMFTPDARQRVANRCPQSSMPCQVRKSALTQLRR